MKNAVRTDVSEELEASIIRVTRIGELETFRRLLATATFLVHRFLSSWWWRCQVPPKSRLLEEPHGVTSQETPFFTSHSCSQSCKFLKLFMYKINWICLDVGAVLARSLLNCPLYCPLLSPQQSWVYSLIVFSLHAFRMQSLGCFGVRLL
jgi:hypothetical protein